MAENGCSIPRTAVSNEGEASGPMMIPQTKSATRSRHLRDPRGGLNFRLTTMDRLSMESINRKMPTYEGSGSVDVQDVTSATQPVRRVGE
jgi:hypothetical protein